MLRLLLAACFLLPSGARANINRTAEWHYYETPHFKILFHPGVRPQADVARVFLEQAFAKISQDLLLFPPGVRITVVLTGLIDDSNGGASPVGHRITLYTRPLEVLAESDVAWLKRVLAHELTHQLTFLSLRNFFGIYGELYKSFYLPVWFMEGVAQYEAENWDAKRNTFFAHVLYNSALEPYPNLSTFTKLDAVSGRAVYEEGHGFVRYLVQHQGPDIVARLLKRVTMIPLWTEFKSLLSPLTADVLPLESALLSVTGIPLSRHWQGFLETVNGGFSDAKPVPAGKPLLPLEDLFDAVYQVKALSPAHFFLTAQKALDQPRVALYEYGDGALQETGIDFIDPVFDLSPDSSKIVFVKLYTGRDGEPLRKAFVRNVKTGGLQFVCDGGSHPVFLGNDSIALSHYRDGRQTLRVCDLRDPATLFYEKSWDGITEIYALSRASRGILFTGADAAGRTHVYEFLRPDSVAQITRDSLPVEFPVETSDSTFLVLREDRKLLQIDSYNRNSQSYSPFARYPLGTFFLHQTGAGPGSVAQSGVAGAFKVTVYQAGPGADSAGPIFEAPDFAEIRSPFLREPLPNLSIPFKEKAYWSLLHLQPLFIVPAVLGTPPLASLGAGIFLQDPLALHTLQADIGPLQKEKVLYSVDYTNGQLPVTVTLGSSNSNVEMSALSASNGADTFYFSEEPLIFSVNLESSLPWDLPVPHGVFFGGGLGYEQLLHRLFVPDTAETLFHDYKPSSWSNAAEFFWPGVFAGYTYVIPSAYFFAHPLHLALAAASWQSRLPGKGEITACDLRYTYPLWKSLTQTLWYQGTFYALDKNEKIDFELPNGDSGYVYYNRRRGESQSFYTSLDFPLYQGYIIELPLLGTWNYAGGALYLDYARESFEKNIYSSRPGLNDEGLFAGAKGIAQFHFIRKIPVKLVFSAFYDLESGKPGFGFDMEMDATPSKTNPFKWRPRYHAPAANLKGKP